jgi:hypothetical protein
MHEDIEALARELDDGASLLQKHALAQWADWLRKDSAFIRKGDFYGIEHLLAAFGGMGSISDLVLPDPQDDARFRSLRSSIYAQAEALRREQA